MTEKRVFISAGEVSGDLHAAALVRALRELHPDWHFFGLGGDLLQEAGVELRAHLVDRAVMGVTRVVSEMGWLLGVTARVFEEFRRSPPDLVILVDYPGLHLNLARMARSLGIPTAYYICPQVWAWAPWRLRRVARRADLLLVVLPFEEPLYGAVHPRVRYVGNPVFDHLAGIEDRPIDEALTGGDPVLALFPGSRTQEVEQALPAMLRTAVALRERRNELRTIVSCRRSTLRSLVEAQCTAQGVDAEIRVGPSHDLQRASFLSLVVSGTATLEQAYFGVPMVVLYPVSRWQRRAFQTFSVTPYISLVNLFAGERVVPEILFAPGEEAQLVDAAVPLLAGEPRESIQARLRELRRSLFTPGAAHNAAGEITTWLAEKARS